MLQGNSFSVTKSKILEIRQSKFSLLLLHKAKPIQIKQTHITKFFYHPFCIFLQELPVEEEKSEEKIIFSAIYKPSPQILIYQIWLRILSWDLYL